jgi:hypothetical protein
MTRLDQAKRSTTDIGDLLARIDERANRILLQNSSNVAKALAKDALELCEMVKRSEEAE